MILMAVGIVAGVAVSWLLSRNKQVQESLLSKLFADNKQLDTTIGIIVCAGLIGMMIHHFHDDLEGEAGYIILAALNGLMAILGYKKGSSDATNNGNGGQK